MCAVAPLRLGGLVPALTKFVDQRCYQSWPHDETVRTSQKTHPYVKVYYSPTMWSWLTSGDRNARIVDGSVMVKEQYPDEAGTELLDWTIMVKDSTVWDGWYWADIGNAISAGEGNQRVCRAYAGVHRIWPLLP